MIMVLKQIKSLTPFLGKRMFLNKKEIIQKINSYNQEEYQTIKQTTRLIIENSYVLFMNWDMERCRRAYRFFGF